VNNLTLLGVLLCFIVLLLIHPALALENHDRNLLDETAGCVPNEENNGIVCTNITLYNTTVLNETLWVTLDLNSSINDTTYVFTTEVWIWVTFRQYVDKLWAHFEFNSSTPNNTWLASGVTSLGSFEVPTGRMDIPTIPVDIDVTHNVTLLTNDCPNFPANETYCDSGTLWATLGIQANGNASTSKVQISASTNEPEAVHAAGYFNFSVESGQFCSDLSERIWFQDNLTVNLDICANGSPCHNKSLTWNTTTWTVTKVFANNSCFNISES